MTLLVIGFVIQWLLLAVGFWLAYQLVLQNGRILLRLEAIESGLRNGRGVDQGTGGLPLGASAPDFELPDLDGQRYSLSQFRGRKVLLLFFNPGCGFCVQMLPDLAARWGEGTDAPALLIIAAGDAEENRQMMREAGVRSPVLLQSGGEVSTRYQVNGTPMSYLVDASGAIASPLTIGAEGFFALAEKAVANGNQPHANLPARGKPNRGLHTSRINRSGLKAGTPAPDFRLPLVGGGEVSLAAYRGKRLLLILSDPHCGPCARIAPWLEDLRRRRSDLEILVVSRGDEAENRDKFRPFTYPVALQRRWEVSKAYGTFVFPVGYLIGEQGTIARDVAVGEEAIMALAADGMTMPPGDQLRAPSAEALAELPRG